MHTIKVEDGTEIFYKHCGAVQPIGFRHGLPLSSDDRDAQMMFFPGKGVRVIAHDRRGHGRSARTTHGNEMDTCAADVAAFGEHLGLHDAFHASHGTDGWVAKAVLIGAAPPITIRTESGPGDFPLEVFDGFRSALVSRRALLFRESPQGASPSCERSDASPAGLYSGTPHAN